MMADEEYEYVEVPVSRKIEIKISLDDLLNGLAQQASSLATGAQQTQLADRLNRLSQLAHDLSGAVNQVGGLDSSVLDKLQAARPGNQS